MSKMRTTFGKGRKWRGVVLLTLVLAVVMTALGVGLTANAAYTSFWPSVAGAETYYYYVGSDGKMSTPLSQTLSVGQDGIFAARSSYCSNVSRFSVSADVTQGSTIQVYLESNHGKNWDAPVDDGSKTTFTYRGGKSINATTINNELKFLKVRFNQSTGETSGKVTLTLRGYDSSGNVIGHWDYYAQKTIYSATCTIQYYQYAKGEIVTTAAQLNAEQGTSEYKNPEMTYRNKYSSDSDSSVYTVAYGTPYETAVPQATVTPVDRTANDSGQGKATFQMRITSGGGDPDGDIPDYGKTVWVGYQISRGTSTPSNSATVYWLKESGKYASGIYTNGSNRTINLYSDERDEIFNVEVPNLDAGVTYTVRGVFATDGQTGACEYGDPVQVRYDPPNINNFKIGSTDQVYKSAVDGEVDENGDPIQADTMNLTMTAALTSGAAANRLEARVYFTPELVRETNDTTGKEEDRSKWYLVDGSVRRSGDLSSFQTSWSVKTPRNLKEIRADYDGDDAEADIDSKDCAYKLVLTDTKTGYNLVEYSDTFKVDSKPPEIAPVMVELKAGEEALAKMTFPNDPQEADPETTAPTTTGGAGATVKVNIGPSDDISGIRSFEYKIYYISSENAEENNWGDTPRKVIRKLHDEYLTSDLVEKSATWTAATPGTVTRDGELKEIGAVTVAKGGYYMIVTRAVDKAGRPSVEQKDYFCVDLSLPSKPDAKLVKEVPGDTNGADGKPVVKKDENGYNLYTTYNEGTYTDSMVWLFAYSAPLTGKTLDTFSFSTDGGLTWQDMLARKTDANGYVLEDGDYVYLYKDYLDPKYLEQAEAELAARRTAAYNEAYAKKYAEEKAAGLSDSDADTLAKAAGNEAKMKDHLRALETPMTGIYSGDSTSYQIGIALSRQKIADYKSITVRATDTLPNDSPSSNAVEMRTIGEPVKTSAVMSHDTVEVALAVGNTTMSVSQVTPALKNAVAKKINVAYYGQDYVDTILNGHLCTWTNQTTFEGACNQDNCPYKTHTELFKPEDVNVQGMADGGSAGLVWTRFDHTNYNVAVKAGTSVNTAGAKVTDSNVTVYKQNSAKTGFETTSTDHTVHIPTVTYLDAYTNSSTNVTTTMVGNDDYPTHTIGSGASAKTLYTAPRDRVVYTAQQTKSTPSTGENTLKYVKDGVTYYIPAEEDTGNTLRDNKTTIANSIGAREVNDYYMYGSYDSFDYYDHAGKSKTGYSNGTGEKAIYKRVYHIIDTSGTAAATVQNNGMDLSQTGNLTSFVVYNGYRYGSIKDFLYTNNSTPTRKEVSFTIEDSYVLAHSSDGHGFFFNTTIRQSTSRPNTLNADSPYRWVISGYALYMGYPNNDSFESIKMWILKFDNVDLECFADGANTAVNSADSQDMTHQIKAGNAWNVPGGGTVQAIASSLLDVTSRTTRNFRLVCEGNWTSVYYWNQVGKNNTQLDAQFTTDSNTSGKRDPNTTVNGLGVNRPKVVSMTGNAQQTAGFVTVQWKNGKGDAAYTVSGTDNQLVKVNGSLTYELTPVGKNPNTESDSTYIYTPRPVVDGQRIGMTDSDTDATGKKATVHTDTNCYGFGPLGSGRSSGHGCYRDSSVFFSNVKVNVVQPKDLSEVVTEPSWGNGKAKFIANISDDAVEDFSDPVLTAQIQWRINNDDTRYIGWGHEDNRAETLLFLNRMMGGETVATSAASMTDAQKATLGAAVESVGYYEESKQWKGISSLATTNKFHDNHLVIDQIDNIADYITKQYYAEFGYDAGSGTLIKDQVAPANGLAKGTVYDLDDVDNIQFQVTPDEYMSSSANPDFPAGRWYMVHDTLGYNTTTDPRSGQYSDALDTNISLPGRYTFYFAPDKDKIAAGTLDPDDSTCVFDFIVNQKPIASFNAQMKMYDAATGGHELLRDGDTFYVLVDGKKSVKLGSVYYPATDDKFAIDSANNRILDANGDAVDANRKLVSDSTTAGVPFAAFETGTEQRNEMVITDNSYDPDIGASTRDPFKVTYDSGTNQFVRVAKDAPGYDAATAITGITDTEWRWELLLPVKDSSGKTTSLNTVVSTAWSTTSPNGKTLAQLVNNSGSLTSYKYSDLDKQAVFTIYQRVKDVSVRRTWDSSAGHYAYTSTPVKKTSLIKQVNVGSSSTESVNAPAAGLSLSKPFIYNTAKGTDALITITRNSSQSQGEPFALTWQYGLPGDKKKDYKNLTQGTGANKYNYYLIDNAHPDGLLVLEYIGDQPGYTQYAITEGETIGNASKGTMTSSTGGIWRVPFDTITTLIPSYIDTNNGLILQATESVFGLSAEDVNIRNLSGDANKHFVSDQTSRTILYKTDKKAPSAPVITSKTTSKTSTGAIQVIDYQASSYLDVSGDYKIGVDTDDNGNPRKAASDQYITIKVGGSKDMEGVLGGYAFYFYDKQDGVGMTSGEYERKYYAYDPFTHSLTAAPATLNEAQQAAAATAATAQANTEFTEKYGAGKYDTTSEAFTSRVAALTQVEKFKQIHGIVTVNPDALIEKLEAEATEGSTTTAALLEANTSETAKLINAYNIRLTGDDKGYMDIIIDGNTMRKDEDGNTKSIDNLNVAFFSFDNQTYAPSTWYGGDTDAAKETAWKASTNNSSRKYSEANETSKTRIEDIKLTKSQPLPPQIEVKNNTNGMVAAISNENGYQTSTGTDVMTADPSLNGYSNTRVDVSFTPKKAKFVKTADGYEKSDSGTEYYEDWTGMPDLTAAANINYYVEYHSKKTAPVWTLEQVTGASDMSEALYRNKEKALSGAYDPIPSSNKLTFSKSGYYELTAWVVNGSRTASQPRTVRFTVDTEAPTGLQVTYRDQTGSTYGSGSWASEVTILVGGATDTIEEDKYEFSLDNGGTWRELGSMANNWELKIPDETRTPPIPSGEYQVLIRAGDKAQNYQVSASRTVKVDRTPPVVERPVLEAESSITEKFEEYVISLSYDATEDANGRNQIKSRQTVEKTDANGDPVLDGSGNPVMEEVVTEWDTEIVVPSEGDVRLEFYPKTGKRLNLITTGSTVNSQRTLWSSTTTYENAEDNPVKTATDSNGKEYQYLDLTKVQADAMMRVEFVNDGVSTLTHNNRVTGTLLAKAAAQTFALPAAVAAQTEEADETDETEGSGLAMPTQSVTVRDAGSGTADVQMIARFDGLFLADGMFSWSFNGKTYQTATPEDKVVDGEPLSVTLTLPSTIALEGITWADGTETIEVPTEVVEEGHRKYTFTFTPAAADNSVVLVFQVKTVTPRAVRVTSSDTSAGKAELVQGNGVTATANGYSVPGGSVVTLLMTPTAETGEESDYAPKKITVTDNGTETVEGGTGTDLAKNTPEGTTDTGKYYYTLSIPAWDSDNGTDAGVDIVVDFEVRDALQDPNNYDTAAEAVAVNIEGKGTVFPGTYNSETTGTVWIPQNGRQLTFTPAEGYQLSRVTVYGYVDDGTGEYPEVSKVVQTVETDSTTRKAIGTVKQESNWIGFSRIVVSFTRKTYVVSTNSNGGGSVDVDFSEVTESATMNAVPEGVPLTINIKPDRDNGYRIVSVVIVHAGTTIRPGAISTYRIDKLRGPLTVSATFKGRSATKTVTVHTITARADRVKDTGADIDETGKPYRYCIRKGLLSDEANDPTVVDYTKWDWTNYLNERTHPFDTVTLDDGTTEKLLANSPYCVFVRVTDKVGNESDPVGEEIYTLANVPAMVSVENFNDSGNTATKSVLIRVDPNDNPTDTEYLVQIGTDSLMSDMSPATVSTGEQDEDGNDITEEAWSVLDDDNKIKVEGLAPGTQYYFQVQARNKNGVETILNKNGTRDIMLSPTAPDPNSFYFKEPASPVSGIELGWATLPEDITSVEIYRDGDHIATVNRSDGNSYVDDKLLPKDGFADSIVNYSYAFNNLGGTGSAQDAVSYEYYQAVRGTTTAEQAKAEKMNQLLTDYSGNSDLYTQLLTYPRFPLIRDVEKNIQAYFVNNMGNIDITLLDDREDQEVEIMGYQQYYLILQGYEPVYTDDTKEVVDHYNLVPVTKWDAVYAKAVKESGTGVETNNITADGKQKAHKSYITTDRGYKSVRASWAGLDNNYVYRIYMVEVRSTGYEERPTSARQTLGHGVEGLLGKTYFVNTEGYGYWYDPAEGVSASFLDAPTTSDTSENAYTVNGQTYSVNLAEHLAGKWNDEDKKTFVGTDDGFDTPIHNSYISFNQSPVISLPVKDDGVTIDMEKALASNAANRIGTAEDGSLYLVVDRGVDRTFKIAVDVSDPDGPGGKKDISVTGEISTEQGKKGLAGNPEPALESDYTMPKNPGEQTRDLLFNAGGVNISNVYQYLTLKAYDGVTETTYDTDQLKLVVNATMPNNVVDSTQYIEVEKPTDPGEMVSYNASITADAPTSDQVGLAKVALYVMKDSQGKNLFKEMFGTNDYDTLITQITTHGSAQETAAKALMTQAGMEVDVDNNAYFSKQEDDTYALTEKGAIVAILCMKPTVTQYVRLEGDEVAAARTILEAAGKWDQVQTTSNTDGSQYYWVPLDLLQDYDLCGWLKAGTGEDAGKLIPYFAKDAQGKDTDDEELNTHHLMLLTHFGGNTPPAYVDFIVQHKPTVWILSDPKLGWVESIQPEYEAYTSYDNGGRTGITIGDQMTRYKDVIAEYGDNLTIEEVEAGVLPSEDSTTSAAKQVTENGRTVYYVYKMSDTQGTVDKSKVSVKIQVEHGVYKQFQEVGMYIAEASTVGSDGAIPESALESPLFVVGNSNGQTPIVKDPNVKEQVYSISKTGLEPDKIYYMWPFYTIEKGGERIASESFSALTTLGNYATAYYGFGETTMKLYEETYKSQGSTGGQVNLRVDAMADNGIFGSVKMKMEYFMADEYGNYVDANGNIVDAKDAVPLTDQETAKATAFFTESGTDTLQKRFEANQSTQLVSITIVNNDIAQGHTNVRVTMTRDVDREEADTSNQYHNGYTMITNGLGSMTVFIQDDESPVKSYKIGVVNQDDDGKAYLTRNSDVYYEYKFPGLEEGYSTTGTLDLRLENIGTGNLENISARVYKDYACTQLSTDFVADTPNPKNLLADISTMGSVQIGPVANQSTGIYTGYVLITAKEMKQADYVKVKITQVVGQTTLKGRVTITPNRDPLPEERIGSFDETDPAVKTYVSIYDFDDRSTPLQTVVADSRGYYEIHNIENGRNKEYQIEVRRDGFVTYSTLSNWATSFLDLTSVSATTSQTLNWDICLRGGDINGDGRVTRSGDMTILTSYFNAVIPTDPDSQTKWTADQIAEMKRCDFNGDGVINVLDRAYLQLNLDFQGDDYADIVKAPAA